MIAETFARIFYRNSINIGLPIIECPEASRGIEQGDEVEVDFDSGIIYNRTKGTQFKGQAFPEFMQKIIKAEGLINYINQKIEDRRHQTMRIIFFAAKSYDRESFNKIKDQYPQLELEYWRRSSLPRQRPM